VSKFKISLFGTPLIVLQRHQPHNPPLIIITGASVVLYCSIASCERCIIPLVILVRERRSPSKEKGSGNNWKTLDISIIREFVVVETEHHVSCYLLTRHFEGLSSLSILSHMLILSLSTA